MLIYKHSLNSFIQLIHLKMHNEVFPGQISHCKLTVCPPLKIAISHLALVQGRTSFSSMPLSVLILCMSLIFCLKGIGSSKLIDVNVTLDEVKADTNVSCCDIFFHYFQYTPCTKCTYLHLNEDLPSPNKFVF